MEGGLCRRRIEERMIVQVPGLFFEPEFSQTASSYSKTGQQDQVE